MDLKILIVVQILLASSNNAQYESDIENERSALEFESLTVRMYNFFTPKTYVLLFK